MSDPTKACGRSHTGPRDRHVGAPGAQPVGVRTARANFHGTTASTLSGVSTVPCPSQTADWNAASAPFNVAGNRKPGRRPQLRQQKPIALTISGWREFLSMSTPTTGQWPRRGPWRAPTRPCGVAPCAGRPLGCSAVRAVDRQLRRRQSRYSLGTGALLGTLRTSTASRWSSTEWGPLRPGAAPGGTDGARFSAGRRDGLPGCSAGSLPTPDAAGLDRHNHGLSGSPRRFVTRPNDRELQTVSQSFFFHLVIGVEKRVDSI